MAEARGKFIDNLVLSPWGFEKEGIFMDRIKLGGVG